MYIFLGVLNNTCNYGGILMNRKLQAALLAIGATTMFTSAMANGVASEGKLLILEAGATYSHAFYKGSVTTSESVTPVTPNGFSINPNNFFPNNFWGGYVGASLYLPGWLLNTRYDMYGSKSKSNDEALTHISLAPVHLSFSVDKVWGCITEFSYGVGAGAVIESVNKGEADIDLTSDNPASESIQGQTRIDPLIEGFLMYQFTNNVGIKFNLAYQIPVNNKIGNGDLNLNLGLNYAIPV